MIVDVMIFLEGVLTCVGHVILILDYLCIALSGFLGVALGSAVRIQIGTTLAMCCFAPLCLRPSLAALQGTSMVGNCAILYTLAFVMMECVATGGGAASLDELSFWGKDRQSIFRAICVMTSAYISHYSAPSFLTELKDQQHSSPWKAFCLATAISFTISWCAYCMFAAAGLVRFVPDVRGNVLLNYEGNSFSFLAWISMACTSMFSFPLHMKPARDTVAENLHLAPVARLGLTSRPSPWAVMTMVVLAVTVLIGMVLSDISSVVGFRGALLGCPISFILPGVMLVCVKPAAGKPAHDATYAFGGGLLIVFGTVAGGLGLYCSVHEARELGAPGVEF